MLWDRDGTLVDDVPYNGDPELVRVRAGAREAVARVREHGLATGVVSNQSGIGRGLITHADVRAVNRRVDTLLGAFDVWEYCPHAPEDACECRKPRPGLIVAACERLGVAPSEVVVVGDIGVDVDAAHAAGASSVLVPTDLTLSEEIERAPQVAADLSAAVDLILHGAGTHA